MGASEMLFVGGFTILCIGASIIACKLSMADMQKRLEQARSEMYYWKRQTEHERNTKFNWRTQSETWRAHYEQSQKETALLKRQMAELQRNRQTQSTPSLAGEEKTIMVKALKKAMFDTHPDRGGKQDEFIKINQLYKKLK